jgi:hypothetical protein
MRRAAGRWASIGFAVGALIAAPGCSSTGGAADAGGDAGGDAGADAGPTGMYRWHTFLDDHTFSTASGESAINVDPSGDIYVAGGSTAWNGPNGESPLNPDSEPYGGLFVCKLDAGGAYRWHTFYGGAPGTLARAVAATADGVYVLGISYGSWDGPNGESPLSAFPHADDPSPTPVVLRLEPDGAYVWHAFFGSEVSSADAGDSATSVFVVPGGDAVVIGRSMPWVGPGGEAPLHAHAEEDIFTPNVFALRLGPDGAYRWHTFYPFTYGMGVAGDDGDIFLSGPSRSWTGPDGEPPIDPLPASGVEGIAVLRLGASGQYRWHTLFGDTPYAGGLLATAEGVFASGTSLVAWDGPAGEPPLLAFSGSGDSGFKGDGYVIAFDPDGNYLWHEFFGPGDTQNGLSSIESGEGGGLYLTGWSEAAWDGPGGEAPITPHAGGGLGGLVLALDADGAYAWHAFFGSDGVYAPIIQSYLGGGALYALGVADGSWSGPNGESPLHEYSGVAGEDQNTFVLKLVP